MPSENTIGSDFRLDRPCAGVAPCSDRGRTALLAGASVRATVDAGADYFGCVVTGDGLMQLIGEFVLGLLEFFDRLTRPPSELRSSWRQENEG